MTVRLTLATERLEVVSGESIEIRATLANEGTSPVSIPTVSLSPIEYRITERDSGDSRLLGQVDDTETLRAGRPAPDLPEAIVRLAPGETVTYRDDLALYAQARLRPGRYRVTAACVTDAGRAEAALDEIVIHPARIESLATLHCFYAQVEATAFSHDGADGAWIFQEDTRTQELRTGVFYRRHELPPGGPVESMAVAVHAQPRLQGRWVGWTRDGAFAALAGWGDALTGLVEPMRIDLTSPRVVSPGFQDGDETCLFLVAGERDGATWVVPCQITGAQDASPGEPFLLCDGRPDRLLARGVDGENGIAGLDIVWSMESAGGVELHALACGPDGRPTGPSRRLYRRDRPLLTWDLAPYAAAAFGAIHLLAGSDSDDGSLAYRFVPLDGSPVEEEPLLPPPIDV